jgi:hypothetical protein
MAIRAAAFLAREVEARKFPVPAAHNKSTCDIQSRRHRRTENKTIWFALASEILEN